MEKVAPKIRPKDDVKPEQFTRTSTWLNSTDAGLRNQLRYATCHSQDGVSLPAITAFRLLAARLKRLGRNNRFAQDGLNFGIEAASPSPVLSPSDGRGCEAGEGNVWPLEPKIALLRASVVIGSLLADGIGDAILVRGEPGAGQSLRLAYNILQRPAVVRSRPITSPVRRAAALCSISRPLPRALKSGHNISKA